jgi:superoxide dismutase, Cu-Zn family
MIFTHHFLLLLIGMAYSGVVCGGGAAPLLPQAKADLVDTKGRPVGTALLVETKEGVRITLDLHDLPPGLHAFHIHGSPHCDAPAFKHAGEHFNPDGKKHGLNNPAGPHAGDLPNITADERGMVKVEVMAPLVTLRDGPHSLFSGEGTSLVIHAKPDDGVSDPAGNSGDRIACGVIRKE